jgi:hypothetical protein
VKALLLSVTELVEPRAAIMCHLVWNRGLRPAITTEAEGVWGKVTLREIKMMRMWMQRKQKTKICAFGVDFVAVGRRTLFAA